MLKPGEPKTIQFIFNKDKLSFYNQQLDWVAEQGKFLQNDCDTM